MKKIMDKLFNNIKFDKRYVLFSIIIILLGIITGSLFIVILKNPDKSLVVEYIQSYIENIKNNEINYLEIFKNTIIINYIIVIVISIIGFTYFFFPVNIMLLFYKSFILGFSLSGFILTYKLKGLIFSIVYIFPHLIINIILFGILTAFSTKLSINMIKSIIKRKNVNMREYFNKYFSIIIMFIFLITITSLYEGFVSTFLIKTIANLLI